MKRVLMRLSATAILLSACGIQPTDEQVDHISQAIDEAVPGVTVRIPDCEEDEPYLRGKGDFDGEKWTRYVCIHIDSIVQLDSDRVP